MSDIERKCSGFLVNDLTGVLNLHSMSPEEHLEKNKVSKQIKFLGIFQTLNENHSDI